VGEHKQRLRQVPGSGASVDVQASVGEVEVWLGRYVPKCVPASVWDARLRDFVVPALLGLAPMGVPVAGRYARALTRIAWWCLGEGIALDWDLVLDPDTVERFVTVGLVGDRSRGTYRADLRRLGRRLTLRAPWEPRPAVVCRRSVAVPYSEGEVAALRADAARQSTSARRRAAGALVVLGAGCGLDGRWSTRVRGVDVERLDGVVVARVGAPHARSVPVLERYESQVLTLAREVGEGLLVGGVSSSKNRACSLAARFEASPGTPRLSAARLRSTWLVHHLEAGTRLPELAAAAGLVGVTVLSDLLEYVAPLSPSDAVRVLRGSGT
jgi:hypothetical protein